LDDQWIILTSRGGWYPYGYGLVYSNSYKREFRKRFPCKHMLTKSELRHEEETRSGYLTTLSDTITNHLNSELRKVFTVERKKVTLVGYFHVEGVASV
jgi:hypothetical protein